MGLLPAIGESFGVSESQTGTIVTLYALAVAVLAVPLTVFTKALPGKYLILGTILAYAVSNLLSALAPTLGILIIARVLGGATHALFFSVAIGYATRLVPPQLTGRALALASAGVSAGLIIGVPLSTALGNAAGWRSAFWALVALLAVAAALVVWLLPDVRRGAPQVTETGSVIVPPEPGRLRDLFAACTVGGLMFLGQYTLYTYVSPLLLTSGVPLVWVAPALLVFGALGMLGIWLSAAGLDRNLRVTALVVLAVMAAGLVGVGLAVPATILVLVIASVWNTASGPMPSLVQSAAVRTHAVSPEIAGAWVNVACNLGIAGGAFLGGLLLDAFDISHVAWGGAACIAVAAIVVLLSRRAFPARAGQ